LITWEYHVLVWVLGLFVKPYVILSVSGIAILPGRLEPGVVNRCVVQDEVNYHANTSLLCRIKKFNEVAQRTIARIDIKVIAYVVAIVAVRCGKEGLKPETVHAKAGEVVKRTCQSLEIPN